MRFNWLGHFISLSYVISVKSVIEPRSVGSSRLAVSQPHHTILKRTANCNVCSHFKVYWLFCVCAKLRTRLYHGVNLSEVWEHTRTRTCMYFSALQLVSVCRNRTESTDSDLNAQTYNINPSSTVAYTHDCYAGFQCAKLKFKHTINNIVFHISVGIVKMGVCLTDRHLHLYHSGCFLFFFFSCYLPQSVFTLFF